ncbi:PspC domain-containing protein, partial [uncultured Bifidobacterium sp.]|uniref:PspC domain-containing protein n=1 Tax=uncultured Bifidobacterium sp. TaxID=165187 RepID=UPI0025979722
MTDSSIPYDPRTPADPRPLRPAALPLMRPKQGRWLCGVCRGISLHLQVSVALARLLFTAAAAVFGAGIVVYVFLWLTMPVGDPVAAAAARLNAVRESPLSRGNAGYGTASADDADAEAAGERDKPCGIIMLSGINLS